MRLKPTPPIFATKLTKKVSKISKELRYKIIETKDVNFDTLIVLGDGDVDDQAVAIICHHLDGTKVVGITKPEKTRISTLKDFPTYISKLKIGKIVLIIDQEDDPIDTIYVGSRTFDFILIVSGLEEIPADKHRIEDHLVKAAVNLGKIRFFPKTFNTSFATFLNDITNSSLT